MKKLISFQVGFQEVTLDRVGDTIVAVVGDVDASVRNKVMFNVDKLTRRGLSVYGNFLGTFQEFHISAKHFDFKQVKAFIETARASDK